MTIKKNDKGLIEVEVSGMTQLWAPLPDFSVDQVLATVKSCAGENGEGMGRALVALKVLANMVSIPNEEPGQVVAGEVNHPYGEIEKQAAQQVTESADNPGLNTDAVQTPDPTPDSAQIPKDPAPADVDSLEEPANPSPSTQILGHDVELTIEEFDNKKITEASDLEVSADLTARGMEVTINGQLYIYTTVDPELPIKQVFDKYNSIKKYSSGKALQWLESQRRLGVLSAAKIRQEAEEPNKVWERTLRSLIRKVLPDPCEVSVLPSPDDWLLEFSSDSFSGSVSANCFSGEWILQWTGKNAGYEKGIGLESLRDKIRSQFKLNESVNLDAFVKGMKDGNYPKAEVAGVEEIAFEGDEKKIVVRRDLEGNIKVSCGLTGAELASYSKDADLEAEGKNFKIEEAA